MQEPLRNGRITDAYFNGMGDSENLDHLNSKARVARKRLADENEMEEINLR